MKTKSKPEPKRRTKPIWSDKDRLAWRPPEDIKPSQWAEKHRRLARGQSDLAGPWRNSNSPHLTAIMDLCALPGLSELDIVKPAQVGGSEALRNVLGYMAHHEGEPCGLALPDHVKGRKIIDNRLLPMFRTTPALRELCSGRTADLSKEQVKLLNGFILHLMWSGSSSSMASDPMRMAIADEVDKFVAWSGKQGDPVTLIKVRLRHYRDRGLFIAISTPSTRYGKIWMLFEDCPIRLYYHVPCPHCGTYQRMVFSNLKFSRGESKDKRAQAEFVLRESEVYYQCPHCQKRIDETHKRAMALAGRYQREDGQPIVDAYGQEHASIETVTALPPRTRVGVKMDPFYCLWIAWPQIASEFVNATGSMSLMYAFKTDTLGEPFDEQVTHASAGVYAIKSQRAALPEGVLPEWTHHLLATVDTQHTHFKAVLRAWGADAGNGIRSQRVYHGRVETFSELDELLFRRSWKFAPGVDRSPLQPSLVLIDTGGTRLEDDDTSRTLEVYRWAIARRARVRPIKGQPQNRNNMLFWAGRAMLSNTRTHDRTRRKTDMVLWLLDVHRLADELADMVNKGKDDPAKETWFLNTRDDPAYNQELSNSVKILVRQGSSVHEEWRPVSDGAPVDYFDCEVYQVCAAYMTNIHLLPYATSVEQPATQTPKTEDRRERDDKWKITRTPL